MEESKEWYGCTISKMLKSKQNHENTAYSSAVSSDSSRALNIVVRNLPESNDVNTKEKVNSLMKDGLKLNINVSSAERKQPRDERETGIVIAKCKDHKDKVRIMKTKSCLKQNCVYENVYIESDKTKSERTDLKNLKTIANVLGRTRFMSREIDWLNAKRRSMIVKKENGSAYPTATGASAIQYRSRKPLRDNQSRDIDNFRQNCNRDGGSGRTTRYNRRDSDTSSGYARRNYGNNEGHYTRLTNR